MKLYLQTVNVIVVGLLHYRHQLEPTYQSIFLNYWHRDIIEVLRSCM